MRPYLSPIRSLGECARYLGIADSHSNDLQLQGISSRASDVEDGDLFIALSGTRHHGAEFIAEACARGARAILTDTQGKEIVKKSQDSKQLPLLVKENPRGTLGEFAQWFYDSPSRHFPVFGVTGTNGKTTTTYLLHQIWNFAGRASGLIGTVGTVIGDEEIPSTFTTPEADALQQLLAVMRERHLASVAMEVSSHALVQGRVQGTHFAAAGFTHLTQDHLDFHKTMEGYYLAKRSLFTDEFCDKAIITIDDSYGRRLYSEVAIPSASLSIIDPKATWHIQQSSNSGIAMRGEGGILIEGEFHLPGAHNRSNLLLAVALAYESGIDPVVIGNSLSHLRGAPGRFQEVRSSSTYRVFVDYAHTPDAVTRVLEVARAITVPESKVIAVLGCGGDRDKTKRPLMGKALNDNADIPIFTSDNPRSEDPEAILDDMTSGVAIRGGGKIIPDRREAIRYAVEIAGKGDVIMILGKGHEIGQEISGTKYPFSDIEVVSEVMAAKS